MSFPLALLFGAAGGFVALSYEILWYRAYGVVSREAPVMFGLVLGAYLVGLALGSWGAGAWCRRRPAGYDGRQLRRLAPFVLVANVAAYLVVPAVAANQERMGADWRESLAFVALAAGLLGAMFPVVAHLGIRADDRVGARLSYLYLANILGSAAGSIVTGFVLFDLLSTRAVAAVLGAAGVALAAAIVLASRPGWRTTAATVAAAALAIFAADRASYRLYDHLWERLQFGAWVTEDFSEVVENRHGAIAISPRGVVYSGGVYDGLIRVDLRDDRNRLVRPVALAGLHPAPHDTLVIGLATGAWAEVLVNLPGMQRMVAVEINPGYLQIMERHPQVAGLLHDPRVSITIDDGRRWLLRHPTERFDLIVMNTSWHARSHSTNLLSRELFELVRAHLRPGGVFLVNTTGSRAVVATGLAVYPHALRIENALALSDAPLAIDKALWRDRLVHWKIGGHPVLDPDVPADAKVLADLLAIADRSAPDAAVEDEESLRRRLAGVPVVTDDNMWAEWWPDTTPP